MNFVWGFLIWIGSGVAVMAMMGMVGFWNLFASAVSYYGVSLRGHLLVWLASVCAFLLVACLMPRTITFPPGADMQFSDERVIDEISEWVWG